MSWTLQEPQTSFNAKQNHICFRCIDGQRGLTAPDFDYLLVSTLHFRIVLYCRLCILW